jgi:hypothetical protein
MIHTTSPKEIEGPKKCTSTVSCPIGTICNPRQILKGHVRAHNGVLYLLALLVVHSKLYIFFRNATWVEWPRWGTGSDRLVGLYVHFHENYFQEIANGFVPHRTPC